VNRSAWSRPVPDHIAHRRAAGRRAYNLRRQFKASQRRAVVVRLVGERGLAWGSQSQIARELGVHRSVVCRDLRAIFTPMPGEQL
jgi:hypothetical protein